MNENETEMLDENKSRPLPIDIPGLLVQIKAYQAGFRKALKDKVPAELPTDGEHFIDCILATLNARAEKQDDPPLNAHYFEDTKDLLRYLHQTQHNPLNVEGQSQWRALAPKIGKGHTVAYEVRQSDGMNKVVAFEPATESIGIGMLEEIAQHAKDLPNAIHNAAMLQSGIQKSASGCPSFGATTLLSTSTEYEGLDPLFGTLSDAEPGKYRLIKDSYANIHAPSDYLHAQSQRQIRGIDENPKWWGRIDITKDPATAQGHSLLQNNLDNRVKQEVEDLETGILQTVEFSNSIDHERLRLLDLVVEDLESLQRDHPDEAGQIFADRLSKVWISRKPGWDRGLDMARSAVERSPGEYWNTTTDTVWKEDHPCWALAPEERAQAITEMLNAIPQWHSSPTLRINVLSRMVEESNRLNLEVTEGASNSIIQDTLKKVPDLIRELAPHIGENEELRHLLALNEQLMQVVPREQRISYLKELATLSETLTQDDLQKDLRTHLIRVTNQAYKKEGYKADNIGIVLSSIGELMQSTHENKNERISRIEPLLGTMVNLTDQKLQSQLKSIVELAVNLNEKRFQQLIKWNAGEDAGDLSKILDGKSLKDMGAVAEEIRSIEKSSDWSSYDAIKRKALASDAMWDDFGDEEDEAVYVKEDKDVEHPLQRLAGIKREHTTLVKYLPEDNRASWKGEQENLEKLLSEWRQRIIKQRTLGGDLTQTDMLVIEDSWARHNEQHKKLGAAVTAQMHIKLEAYDKYLNKTLEQLAGIEEHWRILDRKDPGAISAGEWDELDEATHKIEEFRSQMHESKERLTDDNTPIAREAWRITLRIPETQQEVKTLLEGIRVMDSKLGEEFSISNTALPSSSPSKKEDEKPVETKPHSQSEETSQQIEKKPVATPEQRPQLVVQPIGPTKQSIDPPVPEEMDITDMLRKPIGISPARRHPASVAQGQPSQQPGYQPTPQMRTPAGISQALLAEMDEDDKKILNSLVQVKAIQRKYQKDRYYLKPATNGMNIDKGDVLMTTIIKVPGEADTENNRKKNTRTLMRVGASGTLGEQILVLTSTQVQNLGIKVGHEFTGKLNNANGVGGHNDAKQKNIDHNEISGARR